MQFMCLLILFIDIGTRYIPNMKTCLAYQWNQNRSMAENSYNPLQ